MLSGGKELLSGRRRAARAGNEIPGPIKSVRVLRDQARDLPSGTGGAACSGRPKVGLLSPGRL